jgi:uncharacterized membrane protein YgcG
MESNSNTRSGATLGRMKIALAALVAAALATLANFALLGYANGNSDQVGNLTPQVSLADPATTGSTTTDDRTTSTATTRTETEPGDDGHRRRRGSNSGGSDSSGSSGSGGGSGNSGRDHPEDD